MDNYSRIVALLKVVLPLAALGLLATLFLLSRGADPEATIPFSDADIADRMREQQITAPFFSGTTARGDEIMVTAATARPGADNRPARTERMTGRIDLRSGNRVTLSALAGTLDPSGETALFEGDVRLRTSSGFDIATESLETALGRIEAQTNAPVSGTAPFGRLDAGKLRLTAQTGDGDAHLLFTGGVKLLYQPKLPER